METLKRAKFGGLRAAMAEHGHTQKDVAKYLGRTQSYVSNHFRGRTDWSLNDINSLCKLYNKTYEELFL